MLSKYIIQVSLFVTNYLWLRWSAEGQGKPAKPWCSSLIPRPIPSLSMLHAERLFSMQH